MQRWNSSLSYKLDFPDGSVGKESIYKPGDTGEMDLIPELGRSPGGGKGNPLQYSCLENPMDRGAWLATVWRVTKRVRRGWVTKHSTPQHRLCLAQAIDLLSVYMPDTLSLWYIMVGNLELERWRQEIGH